MAIDFVNVSDDFFANVELQTTMPLSSSRETILHFCEAVQRDFPSMTVFFQRDAGEYVLEGDRETGRYLWLELRPNKLTAGYFNPPSLEEASRLHEWLIERSVYFLGISPIDVECLDVMFGFNLEYMGNRDAIVADALMSGSQISTVLAEGANKYVECQPEVVFSLDEDCYTQARLSLETRNNTIQVRSGQYENEPISVYFTVRRYPTPGKMFSPLESLREQREICEDICERTIVPNVVESIASAISTA